MTRHDTAILGIRFAALYAFFVALQYFASGCMAVVYANDNALVKASLMASESYFLSAGIMAFVGILLFTKAPRVADFFVLGLSESPASPDAPAAGASASSAAPGIGFAIVGLAGFLLAVPRLVPVIFRLFQSNGGGPAGNVYFTQQFNSLLAQMAGLLLQIILSFIIVVKSRALAAWWQRKQAGHTGGET